MVKHTYNVTTPNGTFARTTAHTYGFLVCSLGEDEAVIADRHALHTKWSLKPGQNWLTPKPLDVLLAANAATIASGQGMCHGWSGTKENAIRLLNSLKAERVSRRHRGGGMSTPVGYRNLMVVEVPQ